MGRFNPGQPFATNENDGVWSPTERFRSTLADTAAKQHASQWESIEITLETITPIFGGGTEAGEVDALSPFRPRAIKNAIRHWWWLLNRARFVGRSTDLYTEMTQLFGGASTSKVGGAGRFRVDVTSSAIAARQSVMAYREYARSLNRLTEDKDGRQTVASALNYAGWPLDLDGGETRYVLRPQQKFSLRLSLQKPARGKPDTLADQAGSLVHAISAWVMFGGIGARTSRGFGRIRCTDAKGHFSDGGDGKYLLKSVWDENLGEDFGALNVRIGQPIVASGVEAWLTAIDTFHQFRQARSRTGTVPNRAYLPTADAIRAHTRQTGYSDYVYKGDTAAGKRLNPAFAAMPALMFGAPVPFKFKKLTSRNLPSGLQEPSEGTLNWTERLTGADVPDDDTPVTNRYASPVIVTVVATADGMFAPATVLVASREQQLRDLDRRGSVITLQGGRPIRLSRAQTWPITPTDESTIWSNIPQPRLRDRNNPLMRKPFACALQQRLRGLAKYGNPNLVWLVFFEQASRNSGDSEKQMELPLSASRQMTADERRKRFAQQQAGSHVPRRREGGKR